MSFDEKWKRFNEEEFKMEKVIDVLERLKDFSSNDLLALFIKSRSGSLRNFLSSLLDKVPLGNDDFSKKAQALALLHIVCYSSDEEEAEFLLNLGISPDLEYEGVTPLEHLLMMRTRDNCDIMVDLLTKAQRKTEK